MQKGVDNKSEFIGRIGIQYHLVFYRPTRHRLPSPFPEYPPPHGRHIMDRKRKRSFIEWLFSRSPLGQLHEELDDLGKVLNEQCDSSAERRYREIVSLLLFLLGTRTEFLVLFCGVLLGLVLSLKFK